MISEMYFELKPGHHPQKKRDQNPQMKTTQSIKVEEIVYISSTFSSRNLPPPQSTVGFQLQHQQLKNSRSSQPTSTMHITILLPALLALSSLASGAAISPSLDSRQYPIRPWSIDFFLEPSCDSKPITYSGKDDTCYDIAYQAGNITLVGDNCDCMRFLSPSSCSFLSSLG